MSRSWKIIAIGVFATFVAGNAIAATCKPVTGRITPLGPVTTPCFSPYGLCFQGTATGDFNGSFQSTITFITAKPSDPTTLFFTAETTLTTHKGTFLFSDAGTLTDVDTLTPHAAEVLTVVGPSGASGHLFITGDYVPPFVPDVPAQGFGYLSGQVCLP